MGQEEKNLIFLIFFALFKTKSNIGAGLFYSFFFINQDHVSRFVEWIGFQGFYWIIWFIGFTVILNSITEFKSYLKNLIVRIDNSFSILYIMILLFSYIFYMSEMSDSDKPTTLPIEARTAIISRGVTQLVRPYVCSLEVTSSSLTNLRVTRGLHGR